MGDPAQPLADLDARFEAALPEAFLAARRRMQSSATGVAEEVWRNQEVLLGALRERDALLQELLTGEPAYCVARGAGSRRQSGRVITNRAPALGLPGA